MRRRQEKAIGAERDRAGISCRYEKADELLVAMPSHAAPDHGSIEEVERGE
jgi:hypothetical protein